MIYKFVIPSFVIFLHLCFMGCENNMDMDPVEIEIKSNTEYINKEYRLKLKMLWVDNDSRCPKNVICVWAGDASVTFSMSLRNQPEETFVLHTNRSFTNDTTIGGYKLSLIQLNPYPEHGVAINPEDYEAKLIFERQD